MSDELEMLKMFRQDPVLAGIMDNNPECKALEQSMIQMERGKDLLLRMEAQIKQLKDERNRWKAMAIWFAKRAKFRRVSLAGIEEMFGVTWKWDEFKFNEHGEQE